MKQAIAGVAPANLEETTVMTVWPTIAAMKVAGLEWPIGLWIGKLCSQGGKNNPAAIGKLWAALMIVPSLILFAVSIAPPFPTTLPFNRRYRLTNRRLIVLEDHLQWFLYRPWGIPVPWLRVRTDDAKAVSLDRFDAVSVEVLPGQDWYPAGELIFKHGGVETFRLSGVSRPEAFRQACIKTQRAYTLVAKAMA